MFEDQFPVPQQNHEEIRLLLVPAQKGVRDPLRDLSGFLHHQCSLTCERDVNRALRLGAHRVKGQGWFQVVLKREPSPGLGGMEGTLTSDITDLIKYFYKLGE